MLGPLGRALPIKRTHCIRTGFVFGLSLSAVDCSPEASVPVTGWVCFPLPQDQHGKLAAVSK